MLPQSSIRTHLLGQGLRPGSVCGLQCNHPEMQAHLKTHSSSCDGMHMHMQCKSYNAQSNNTMMTVFANSIAGQTMPNHPAHTGTGEGTISPCSEANDSRERLLAGLSMGTRE